MKKLLAICILLGSLSIQTYSQNHEKNCYFGFTFEVSENPNWGYGELVITDVEANSPAEKAGIKMDDIIMEINGKATYLRDNHTIAKLLFEDMYAPTVNFTIRNMNTYFKEYTLHRKCISTNAVSEKDLSSIFSFYSLENTCQRIFSLPLRVEPRKEVDFADYHSFDFSKSGSDISPIENQITTLLEKELQAKGLVRDTSDPDIVVQLYYSYGPNPKFTGLENPNYTPGTWRYDEQKQQMVLLPIINTNDPKAEILSQNIVEFGFSFYDRKYIDTKQLTQIWDCSIRDYLSGTYTLEEYVRIHTPLMLKEFPYTTAKTMAKYKVSFNKYNYTGIYFDADDLATISDVDQGSPAYIAGIRPGYVVKRIDNKKLEYTKESLSEGYKKFISETMVFRNPATRFINSEGFKDCMFWDIPQYAAIAKELNKPQYLSHFAYLYGFEKYINNKAENKVTIEAWDGMQTRLFNITPEIRKSVVIKPTK